LGALITAVVGAGHGISAAQVVEGVARKRALCLFFLVEEAYTQQGRAHIRRLRPDWAARPALLRRAAHAVERLF
jgi:hypothetical protein